MPEITIGGRTVKTSMIPVVDFAKGMRAAQSDKALAANANLMTDVNVPLFSGKDLPNDQRSQYPDGGDISVNLGKMANMPQGLLDAIGTTQVAPCQHTGNTPEGTPIQVNLVKDMSHGGQKSVQMTMDLQAVAYVNDVERDKGREAKGLDKIMSGDPKADRRNPKLGRLDVNLSGTNTSQGVPAMSQGSLCYNLGEQAAQNHLMTTPTGTDKNGASKAGKYMVSKEDVSGVAASFAKEYKAFVTKYADKPCPGIKAMDKQADGTYKPGKDTIDGTSFKSLKEMGFAPVTLKDGSVAVACVDGSKEACDTRKGPEGLKAFNEAFNKHMSQVINQQFPAGSMARTIGLQHSVESYPVTVPGSGVTMLQPSSEFTVKSFANAVTTNIECATHENKKPVEQIYGKEILDNTRKIQSYFPEKGGAEERDKVFQEVKDKIAEKGMTAMRSYDAPQNDDGGRSAAD